MKWIVEGQRGWSYGNKGGTRTGWSWLKWDGGLIIEAKSGWSERQLSQNKFTLKFQCLDQRQKLSQVNDLAASSGKITYCKQTHTNTFIMLCLWVMLMVIRSRQLQQPNNASKSDCKINGLACRKHHSCKHLSLISNVHLGKATPISQPLLVTPSHFSCTAWSKIFPKWAVMSGFNHKTPNRSQVWFKIWCPCRTVNNSHDVLFLI